MDQMQTIKVLQTFVFWGTIPSATLLWVVGTSDLTKAVGSVRMHSFFDEENGQPMKQEVKEVDIQIKKGLCNMGWSVQSDYPVIPGRKFNVDLACKSHKLLIEIEKGKLPRLELDIMKMVAACNQFPEKWQLGALIVPATHIELPLEGRQTPYCYLKERLHHLVKPLLESSKMAGLLVVGYADPAPEPKKP